MTVDKKTLHVKFDRVVSSVLYVMIDGEVVVIDNTECKKGIRTDSDKAFVRLDDGKP